MKIQDSKKGNYIINTKIKNARPWWVVYKYTGMIIVRRGPKVGKVVAITARQLTQFKKHEEKDENKPENENNKTKI